MPGQTMLRHDIAVEEDREEPDLGSSCGNCVNVLSSDWLNRSVHDTVHHVLTLDSGRKLQLSHAVDGSSVDGCQ